MDYRQAAREWSHQTFRPIYILHGTENYIMGEWIALLTKSAVEPGTEDFALSKYDLTETPIETVLEDAETIPFLSQRKLVVANGAYFLTGSKGPGKSTVEHNVEALQEYVSHPAEHAVVVLTVPAEKLDERKKIVKQLKSSALVLPFAPLGLAELEQWIRKKAAGFQVSMEDDAVETLLARTGGSCETLAAELEKMSLYVGSGGTIQRSTVEQLAVRTTEQNVFQLVEEIVQLRPEKAMSIFHDLLREKEEPIKLLFLIARQFRIILGTKELSKQGFSQAQIASKLGAHPYAIKLAGEQAKRFKPETLERIVKELADLDYAMKTGAIDKTLGLELFILRIGAAAAVAK